MFGLILIAAFAVPPIEPVPRVQCLIFSDSPRCAPCRELAARVKTRLVDEIKSRGENAWSVGPEGWNRFRLVEVEEAPYEVSALKINSVPVIYWLVDGTYQRTYQTDPAELAYEYLRRLKKLETK